MNVTCYICIACGIHGDENHCWDFCNRHGACDQTFSDEDWDECFDRCEENEYPRKLVECFLSKPCDQSVEANYISCTFDPMESDVEK